MPIASRYVVQTCGYTLVANDDEGLKNLDKVFGEIKNI